MNNKVLFFFNTFIDHVQIYPSKERSTKRDLLGCKLSWPVLLMQFAKRLGCFFLFFSFFPQLSFFSSHFVITSYPSLYQDQGSRLWVKSVGCVGRAVGASAGLLSRLGRTAWQPGGKALLKIHCWESD